MTFGVPSLGRSSYENLPGADFVGSLLERFSFGPTSREAIPRIRIVPMSQNNFLRVTRVTDVWLILA